MSGEGGKKTTGMNTAKDEEITGLRRKKGWELMRMKTTIENLSKKKEEEEMGKKKI